MAFTAVRLGGADGAFLRGGAGATGAGGGVGTRSGSGGGAGAAGFFFFLGFFFFFLTERTWSSSSSTSSTVAFLLFAGSAAERGKLFHDRQDGGVDVQLTTGRSGRRSRPSPRLPSLSPFGTSEFRVRREHTS